MASSNIHRSAGNHCSSAAQAAVSSSCQSRVYAEGGHQLEKLEFALAVAMTRGDHARVDQLRAEIDALGGNREEPGT